MVNNIIWYYGNTGVGKSYRAFQDYDDETHYVYFRKGDSIYDGLRYYRREEKIIIDNLEYQRISYEDLIEFMEQIWKTNVELRIASRESPEKIYNENNNFEKLYEMAKVYHVLDKETMEEWPKR